MRTEDYSSTSTKSPKTTEMFQSTTTNQINRSSSPIRFFFSVLQQCFLLLTCFFSFNVVNTCKYTTKAQPPSSSGSKPVFFFSACHSVGSMAGSVGATACAASGSGGGGGDGAGFGAWFGTAWWRGISTVKMKET